MLTKSAKSIERLSLKAVLSIGKQELCLLKSFCGKNGIACSGRRVPWCELELKVKDGKLAKVAKEKIISILLEINSSLQKKTPKMDPAIMESKEDFICPFFKQSSKNCILKICPYNSQYVKTTNCILSLEKSLSLTELSVIKDISKRTLLKIIFSIEAGKRWELVSELLEIGISKVAVCKCGHFQAACNNKPDHCERRSALHLKEETIVPEKFINNYPLILVMLVTSKVFAEWSNLLYSKKVIQLYWEDLKLLF